MTTATITMPTYSGGRQRAQSLMGDVGVPLRGIALRLDCRGLVAGTPSFADEFIQEILIKRGVARLIVEYAGMEFASYLRDAARDHGVGDRVEII